MVCEVGRAVGAEGLVAGQIVDIKSEGMAEQVRAMLLLSAAQVIVPATHQIYGTPMRRMYLFELVTALKSGKNLDIGRE